MSPALRCDSTRKEAAKGRRAGDEDAHPPARGQVQRAELLHRPAPSAAHETSGGARESAPAAAGPPGMGRRATLSARSARRPAR